MPIDVRAGGVLPLAHADSQALRQATAPVVITKSFDQEILGRTKKNIDNITLRVEPSGQEIISHHGSESFRILPLSISTADTVHVLANDTTVILNITSGQHFLTEVWTVVDVGFKLELCWNLPNPRTIAIPTRGIKSFFNGTFQAENQLIFEWKDAMRQGFSPAFDNGTRSIILSLPMTGCFDPVVQLNVVSGLFVSYHTCRTCVIYDETNKQWLVEYLDLNGLSVECSKTGSVWNNAPTIIDANSGLGYFNFINFFYNGTVWLAAYNPAALLTVKWRPITPSVNCGLTLGAATTVASVSCCGSAASPSITQNSTGTIFIAYGIGSGTGSSIALAISQDKGSGRTWITNRTMFPGRTSAVQLTNLTDSKIMGCTSQSGSSTGVVSRIYYATGNQTFGTETVITTDTLQTGPSSYPGYHCFAGNSGIAFVTWLTSSGVLKYKRFDGSSWSTTIVIGYPGTGIRGAFGLTKFNGNNTVVVFRALNGTNTLKWNLTDTAGANFVTNGDATISNSTATTDSMGFVARPNSTGFIGLIWERSPVFGQTDIIFDAIISPSSPNGIVVASGLEWEREAHIASSTITSTLAAGYIWGNGTIGHLNSCAVKNSNDNGLTWNATTKFLGLLNTNNANQNHSVVTVDANGRFWTTCSQHRSSNHTTSYILFSSSGDGVNWNSVSDVSRANDPNVVDKPWIVADTWSASDYKNSVYTCWSRFNATYSEILFRKIAPLSSPEKVLYRVSRSTADVLLTGCNMAVGPKGEVYVSWLHLLTSTDASIEVRWNELGEIDWGWGRVHNATSLKRFPTSGCPSNPRGLGCLTGTSSTKFAVSNDPSVSIDMLGGVHVVYADYSTTAKGEIKYINSGDCKRDSLVDICSWTSPLTINKDSSNNDQWEPAMHVSSRTNATNPRGIIHVSVLDRRDDTGNIKWKVYDYYCLPATLSTCTGSGSWNNTAISDVQLDNAGKNYIGEYHGITNTSTKDMYTAWTDSRNFSGNGFDIYADWEFK